MRCKNIIVFFFIFFICATFGALSGEASPKRIVSLSPVGTEMLFDLGQGDNIIAVTKYCDYPAAALKKPKIGGYAEVNFEALIAIKTDLLVLQDIHAQFTPQLERLKIPYFILRQNSIGDIRRSITELGKICGAEQKAAARVASIDAELTKVTQKTAGAARPRVMLCVSRELSEPKIRSFYIAGRNTFYNELITLAGGENASTEKRIAYPHISVEGLLRLNPDVIIDLVGDRDFYHSKDPIDKELIFSKKYLTEQWRKSAAVNAVRSGRVAILEGTLYLRPGPRVGQIVLAFARAIHPELKW